MRGTPHNWLCLDAWLAVAILMGVSVTARAEIALDSVGAAPTPIAPGGSNGVKVGDGRMHPFLELDSQFVTNPGRETRGQENSDFLLVMRPGAELAFPSPKLELNIIGSLEYRRYVELQDLSAVAGRGGVALQFNKEGAISLRFNDQVVRSDDPGNQTESARLQHTSNTVGLGLDAKPGGGALMFSLDYSFFIDYYDRDQAGGIEVVSNPELLDNMRHIPALRATWKFLPKTSAFLEARAQLTRFDDATFQGTDAAGNPVSASNVGSNVLESYLGVTGALTTKIAVLLKAGYGDTLIPGSADNFRSVVGQLETTWSASQSTKLRAGVLRVAQPAALFKYFAQNKGYARLDQGLGAKLQLGLGVEYSYYAFGQEVIPTPGNDEPRRDHSLLGNFGLNYALAEWMTISLIDQLDVRASNYRGGKGNVGYTSNSAFVRFALRY